MVAEMTELIIGEFFDGICDRCGCLLSLENSISSDGLTLCDDCACLVADEEFEGDECEEL